MRTLLTARALAAGLAVAASSAPAVAQLQSLVLPAALAGTRGTTVSDVLRDGPSRVQCLYDGSLFTAQYAFEPLLIHTIELRLGADVTGSAVTFPQVDVYLQDAAVDHASTTTTFASQRSAPLGTPNWSGPLTITPQAGTSPNGWCATIALTTPFAYRPANIRDLLIEFVVHAAPTPALAVPLDAAFSSIFHQCRALKATSTTATTGTVSIGCPTLRIGYTTQSGAAAQKKLGRGCTGRSASVFETFANGINDLANKTVTFTRNVDGGWDVAVTPGSTIVPPTGTGLALGDDSISGSVSLPFPFQHPGTATAGIIVDANGSIAVTGTVFSCKGGSADVMYSHATTRLCPAAMDLVPDGATNVDNVFANVHPTDPTTFLVTWRNVPCAGAPSARSTFQVALIDNGTDDRVEFRYGNLQNAVTATNGAMFVGYCRGYGTERANAVDLTSGVSAPAERLPLELAIGTRPTLGQNVPHFTRNVPPTAPVTLFVLGLVPLPGLDLATIGAPGCEAWLALPELFSTLQTPGVPISTAVQIPIDPVFAGLVFRSQVVALDPTANAAQITTSNALESTIGSF